MFVLFSKALDSNKYKDNRFNIQNIIKQCAFIHVGLKNLTMGCSNLVLGPVSTMVEKASGQSRMLGQDMVI